jgi:methane/ammonia monooxygenase subunit A
MAATATAVSAAEAERERLRGLLHKQYRWLDYKWDVVFWITAAFVVGAAADITKLLFAGDWDFWTDWKDRQWWPIVSPFAFIIIPSALQYIQWLAWRFPTGATYTAVAMFLCSWVGRVFQWQGFVSYPLVFVWPATIIPAAIFLDWVLLKTKSFVLTSILGGYGLVVRLLVEQLHHACALPAAHEFHGPRDVSGRRPGHPVPAESDAGVFASGRKRDLAQLPG